VSELFVEDAIDRAAATQGLGPAWSTLRASWMSQMQAVLEAAQLQAPELNAFCSTGRRGVHSEHMGFLLAEMQHLQRTYPGAVW
jgi:ring-1,2-phenylacetyl-CoA epoxidase subunit PaaC